MHISTRYAKILGETNFEPWEFPQSGKMKERAKVGNNNGQQRIANATSGGACKAAGTKKKKRLKFANNNGQLRIANATTGGARKAAWAKKGVKTMASFPIV